MKRSEIQSAVGGLKQTINGHLRTLRANELAHIAGWEFCRNKWAPLWVAGPGENVPEPDPEEPYEAVMSEVTAARTSLRRGRMKIPDFGCRTSFVGDMNPWTGVVSTPADCADISRIQASNQREWDRYATQRRAYSTPPAKEF